MANTYIFHSFCGPWKPLSLYAGALAMGILGYYLPTDVARWFFNSFLNIFLIGFFYSGVMVWFWRAFERWYSPCETWKSHASLITALCQPEMRHRHRLPFHFPLLLCRDVHAIWLLIFEVPFCLSFCTLFLHTTSWCLTLNSAFLSWTYFSR